LATASDVDKPLLSAGALTLGPGEALAWSEMARGLLLHRVRLEPGRAEASVADYKIVAPTEWNFHPRGAVASILAQLPATAEDAAQMALQKRRISVLAAAFDPCVSYEIEFEHA
ncbi:MAG: nickel-dependent hydrogenase large subunit, partial [Burkholderiaceae bacterium]|nr:nickel-dependent hydrogenase large subunit [Burkholderiaceae bacterium]